MNKRQRRVLGGAAAVVVLMLLHAPFFSEGRGGGLRYGWLFQPPYEARVDVGLLLAEWIAVGIVTAILYYVLKD